VPGLVLRELLDLALVTALLYGLIVSFRGARARLVLVGVGLLGVLLLAARQLGLTLTAVLLQGLLLVALVLSVLVFQEDLRRVLERLAQRLTRGAQPQAPPEVADVVARAAFEMGRQGRGALLVLPRRDPLERHGEGGLPLDGRITEALLLSLFDPNSPGHDGAAIVEGDRVTRFAVHLPLSHDFEELGGRGTRHAAGLGLSERTDAACVIVSEERGEVSLAHRGRLNVIETPADLALHLRVLAGAVDATQLRRQRLRERLRAQGVPLLLALAASLALWVLMVPGSETAERAFLLPVEVDNLPAGFVLEEVQPSDVEVVVTGPRRLLLLLDSSSLDVRVDAFLVQLGRRTFEINPAAVQHPPGVGVSAVEPNRVQLRVREPTKASDASGR